MQIFYRKKTIMLLLLILFVAFGALLWLLQKSLYPTNHSKVQPSSHLQEIVKDYLQLVGSGQLNKAAIHLTGDALRRFESRKTNLSAEDDFKISNISIVKEKAFSDYAEVIADTTVYKNDKADRAAYQFRLHRKDGEWKIFEQRFAQVEYEATIDNELEIKLERVVSDYLIAASNRQDVSDYMLGKKALDAYGEVRNLQVREVGRVGKPKEGRMLLEAKFDLVGSKQALPKTVLFEAAFINEKWMLLSETFVQ